MRILVPLLACLALLTAPPAFAAKKEGVSMPDTVEVAGQKLVLNGLGVREASPVRATLEDVFAQLTHAEDREEDAS